MTALPPYRSLQRTEAEGRRALLEVLSYDLSLDLASSETEFSSRTVIRFRSQGGPTFADLKPVRLHTARLNGRPLDVDLLDSGCCGMAGSFGFMKEKYPVSMQCAERVLLPAVRKAEAESGTLIVADGFSCREQLLQTTDAQPLHLAQVLQMALHQDR